jgi:predicted nicotinamide N-methyase
VLGATRAEAVRECASLILVKPDFATGPAAEFIRAHTRVCAPPLIPEVALHLSGDEPIVLWEETESETGRADLPPPFWAYPWAGGIALARYLLDHRELVTGRVVLDLAAGSGLVAVAASLAGAARVYANDIDPMAAAAIALNGEANATGVTVIASDLVTPRPAVRAVSGSAATADPAAAAGPSAAAGLSVPGGPGMAADPAAAGGPAAGLALGADVVLVGDAFYERRMAHRMLAFLRQAQAAGARVLVGDPGRTYLPADGLRAVASYAVPAWAGLEDTDIKQTTVWELC